MRSVTLSFVVVAPIACWTALEAAGYMLSMVELLARFLCETGQRQQRAVSC
jgi:hypothetical protein